MPKPLDIPQDAPELIDGALTEVAAGQAGPYVTKFVVKAKFGLFGRKCTFTTKGAYATNLGVYGPNPTVLGAPFGRGRSPKLQGMNAAAHAGTWNLTPGTYYAVVRSGEDGPPTGAFTLSVTTAFWFGR